MNDSCCVLAFLHARTLSYHSTVMYKIRIYLKDAKESERRLQYPRVQGRQIAQACIRTTGLKVVRQRVSFS